jgi:hypothetical protein
MGLKRGAIGNSLGEYTENLRNIVGNKGKKKEKKSSYPTRNLKETNSRHFECMLSLRIGCMKFLFSKLWVTILG